MRGHGLLGHDKFRLRLVWSNQSYQLDAGTSPRKSRCPAAVQLPKQLRYVDGDLGDPATYQAAGLAAASIQFITKYRNIRNSFRTS